MLFAGNRNWSIRKLIKTRWLYLFINSNGSIPHNCLPLQSHPWPSFRSSRWKSFLPPIAPPTTNTTTITFVHLEVNCTRYREYYHEDRYVAQNRENSRESIVIKCRREPWGYMLERILRIYIGKNPEDICWGESWGYMFERILRVYEAESVEDM